MKTIIEGVGSVFWTKMYKIYKFYVFLIKIKNKKKLKMTQLSFWYHEWNIYNMNEGIKIKIKKFGWHFNLRNKKIKIFNASL